MARRIRTKIWRLASCILRLALCVLHLILRVQVNPAESSEYPIQRRRNRGFCDYVLLLQMRKAVYSPLYVLRLHVNI